MKVNAHLARVFVELSDTLVADFGVIEFLHRLVEVSVDLLGVQAAGLMLADQRGVLQLAAYTDARTGTLEQLELQDKHGPCSECYTTGLPVVNIDTDEATARWPHFMAATLLAGFASVHAVPMRLRGQVIGAMNLFCTDSIPLDEDRVALTQALADVATIGLLQQRLVQEKTMLSEQLQTALNSRIVIEEAKGMLAQRFGLGMNAAFEAMRTHARRQHQSIRVVATEVIDGTVDFTSLRTPN